MPLKSLLVGAALVLSISARAIQPHNATPAATCESYSKMTKLLVRVHFERCSFFPPALAVISTRGTTEPQGPSIGFRTMNGNVLKHKPGGNVVSYRVCIKLFTILL